MSAITTIRTVTFDEWAAALRSGAYAQGRGQLRSDASETARFCCLGVKCNLQNPDGWGGYNDARTWTDGVETQDGFPTERAAAPLPTPMGRFRLSGKPGRTDREWRWMRAMRSDGTCDLIDVNDDWELPFAEIADLIDCINDPDGPFAWIVPGPVEVIP